MYVSIALGTTALQGSNNRKINLYRKYRENKLQVLAKTIVIYAYRVAICTIVFTMNRGVNYWVIPFFTTYKDKISEEKMDQVLLFQCDINKCS